MSTYRRRRLIGAAGSSGAYGRGSGRPWSVVVVTVLMLGALAVVPGKAGAQASAAAAPVPTTVPALADWTPQEGSYAFGRTSRIVVPAQDGAARRVARTLAGDLRDAGHGAVPVVSGRARSGDIAVDVAPGRDAALGAEGYELTAGKTLSITGAAEPGAFYGSRTLLQMLAQGEQVPAGSTVDVPRYAERGVGVCACHIHITTDWLENLVRDMAYNKLNQLLLELKVKSDRHPEANSWGYYTKSEIRELVALGEKYHVTIIPEINSPGHMEPWIKNRTDLQLTDSEGRRQPSRLDVTQDAAFDYYTDLIDAYAEVFTADSWHMGADEYMLGSDFAQYPHIQEYARKKYGPDATPQDAFIDFVNRVHDHVTARGKKLRIWNDGLTGDHTVPLRTDTTVEHWLKVATPPSELVADGHRLMNAAYSLYLVRGGFHTDTRALYEKKWNPRVFEGETLASDDGVTGAKISLWPDNGRGETENEVAATMDMPLHHLAQTTWGEPAPDATYDRFAERTEAVGHAPGHRDLTRVPVADGTYTLKDTQGRAEPADFTIERTTDGYATLKTATGGRCLETRTGELTLNVPLEAGTPVTEETCDAKNTLQRWQLERARGGYLLTNAITRMSVHVTAQGELLQYPPDQKAPAVWELTDAR